MSGCAIIFGREFQMGLGLWCSYGIDFLLKHKSQETDQVAPTQPLYCLVADCWVGPGAHWLLGENKWQLAQKRATHTHIHTHCTTASNISKSVVWRMHEWMSKESISVSPGTCLACGGERKRERVARPAPFFLNKPLMTTSRLDYLSLPEPHYLYRQTDSGHCTLLLLQFVFVLIVATCLTNLPLSPSIYVLICACSGVVVNTSPGQGKTCWFYFSWRKNGL